MHRPFIILGFLLVSVLAAGPVRGAQLTAMQHPQVTIERVRITRDQFDVQPIGVQSFSFDSTRSSFQQPVIEPQHLDFGSRQFETTPLFEESHNSRFSNIKMQFQDQQFQHLNFNAE